MTLRMRLAAAAASVALTVLAAPALAQQRQCGDRDAIVDRLETKYGEARTGAGLSQSNGIVELYASAETGTWTILLTLPTGQTCLVAAGRHWEAEEGEIKRSGQPA